MCSPGERPAVACPSMLQFVLCLQRNNKVAKRSELIAIRIKKYIRQKPTIIVSKKHHIHLYLAIQNFDIQIAIPVDRVRNVSCSTDITN